MSGPGGRFARAWVWVAAVGCSAPPIGVEPPRTRVALPGLGLDVEVPEGTEMAAIENTVHVTQRPRTRNPQWMSIARAGAEDRGVLDQRDGALQYRLESSDAGMGGVQMALIGSITIDDSEYDVSCQEDGEEAPSLGWCLVMLRTLRARAEADVVTPVAEAKATPQPSPPPPPSAEEMLAALTGDELLVLRSSREPHWRGLRRTTSQPEYRECELVGGEDHAHLDLIRGEVRLGKRRDEWHDVDTCEVVRVDSHYSQSAHPLRPLTVEHLGEMVLGLPPAEQTWLTNTDLDRGPLRAFVGLDTKVVRFASGYLQDLGTHFAIPGRPLITRAELEVALAARQARGDRYARLNGADNFSPQVKSHAERMVWARLPVISVTTRSGVDDGPAGVALRVGDETRWLMFQQHQMKWSWEAAFRRGRVIERIVEDGARPGE